MDSAAAKAKIDNYFKRISSQLEEAYKIANKARKQGYDPEDKVDIPIARDMADRVEGLISSVAPQLVGKGLPERIKELEKIYGLLDWRVALVIAEEVSKEKFCKFKDKKEAMEVGIRAGFLYNTLGIVAAPLEGFIELEIKKRKDGKEYLAVKYAGPIRGAGGTAASVSVIIADYVRLKNGYHPYDPDEKEINRFVTEITDYNERVTNLQYKPSDEEIKFLVQHIPVEISGEPTEKIDVSNYKDLPRIDTNKIRGGVCLVLAEGVAQKCNKLWKRLGEWGEEMGLSWQWMGDFISLQKKIKAKGQADKKDSSGSNKPKITPNYTFITDMVAGRPVYTYPMRNHGFRLRYGRGRNTGFSAAAIHPFTMYCVYDFIALGTQLKVERPGKAASMMSCDTIDPPIIKLKNGDVIALDNSYSPEQVRKLVNDIDEILFLGDILFNYGDFSENGHILVPCGYCPEWWILELEKAMVNTFGTLDIDKLAEMINYDSEILEQIFKDYMRIKPSPELALSLSKNLAVPLHPAYIFFWKLIKAKDFLTLIKYLDKIKPVYEDDDLKKLVMPLSYEIKTILENVGIPHINATNEYIVIEKDIAKAFLLNLGIENFQNIDVQSVIDRVDDLIKEFSSTSDELETKTALDLINKLVPYTIRDRAGTFIGARMGRPEKAKMRKLTGSPQVLFPVGDEGGRLRSFNEALVNGKITADFSIFVCTHCNHETIYHVCEVCDKKTVRKGYCTSCQDLVDFDKGCPKHGKEFYRTYRNKSIDIKRFFSTALKRLDTKVFPDLIKGVKGTSNKDHIPEHLVKGILRAKHDIYVNKDGTTRYDFSEEPITHFKPLEIGTSVEKLKELGYTHDIYGNKLEHEDQILEMFPQDIVISSKFNVEEPASTVLFRVGKFVDELLVKLYRLKPFYNFKSPDDLVGSLVIGLAPHISAGMVGRIIGFTDAQACFASPLWHAALRRDCDGDECAVILLMDALLNFSRQFLPDKRGGRTMDAPLVLTSELNPAEVDDQALGVDIVWKYPLEFYEAAQNYKWPKEAKLEQIADRVTKENQFLGYGFTHDTTNINTGVKVSAYKTLPSMFEKLEKQMKIASIIRAVDESDVARLVIDRHFLKDTKGNLRKFSMQQFRCVKCNEKYRRPPLRGVCVKCNGKIIFTIHESSAIKYLDFSINLAKEYNVPAYLKQTLDVLKRRVEGVFGKDKEVQSGLSQFF